MEYRQLSERHQAKESNESRLQATAIDKATEPPLFRVDISAQL